MTDPLHPFGRVNPLAALTKADRDVRRAVLEHRQQLRGLGWATEAGGGLTLRQGDWIYAAPKGAAEGLTPADVYVLDLAGQTVERPSNKELAPSPCVGVAVQLHREHGAAAVVHSHSLNAFLATVLFDDAFRLKDAELLRGVDGFDGFQAREIPILDSAAPASSLSETLRQWPKAEAILLRRHGVYVWGPNAAAAMATGTRYDYLFNTAIRLKQMGIDDPDATPV